MHFCICSRCLGTACFKETGLDEYGNSFALYLCPTCGNFTRIFRAVNAVIGHEVPCTQGLTLTAERVTLELFRRNFSYFKKVSPDCLTGEVKYFKGEFE